MNTCFGSYTFGDTLVRYLRNEDGQVGLDITPLSLQKQLTEKKCVLSPLAHIALRGDPQSSWTAGHSMLFAPAVGRFRFSSQTKEAAPAGTAIKTVRKGTRCGRTLVLVHAFSSPLPENISLAVSASSVSRVFGCAPERVSLEGGRLTVRNLSEFEGIGILLE